MDKMKRNNQDIKIVPMEKSMLSSVANIASMTLGDAFINESILNNDINLCVEYETEIVAYSTTKIVNSSYFKSIFKNKSLKQLEIYEKVGYLDSLAVNQDYTGKGIGTLLLKNTILKLKENNINFVLMAAWKNITEVNIKALAKKEGFKEEFEIKNFWSEDSIKEKFDCTVCGKPPCLCSAVIYTKELNS